MENTAIQELILDMMPLWHCRILKPFKQLLDDGISPDMYYTIKLLCRNSELMTMSELAQRLHIPKQQSTRLVNRLIELSFVERVPDSGDRRRIRLRPTAIGLEYIDGFVEQSIEYYRQLLEQLSPEDRDEFADALCSINRILGSLPNDEGADRPSLPLPSRHCSFPNKITDGSVNLTVKQDSAAGKE